MRGFEFGSEIKVFFEAASKGKGLEFVMNPAPGRVSGHLDPCAQEFTPGPYSLLRAAPPPPPPPPPPLYYSSYPLDGRQYVQPTASAGSIPVNPVMPLYNTTEVGIPYNVATIPQPWDNTQHQQQPFRLGMQVGEAGVGLGLGLAPTRFPLVRKGTRPYRYNNNENTVVARSEVSGAYAPTGWSSRQYCHQQPFTSVAREHHPSRALLLSYVAAELSDTDLRQQLERWGPVRALQTEKRQQGLVTVHYYDLRHAKTALTEIQEQHLTEQMRLQQHYSSHHLFRQSQSQSQSKEEAEEGIENTEGSGANEGESIPPPPPPPPPPAAAASSRGLIGGKAIWAQYVNPVGVTAGEERHNQGTLVVFNLDADIDTAMLRSIFEAFGAVKELRETPAKRQHKFVEFFDVRDAARALAEMDGQEIGGKRVKIEFSRPGGHTRLRPTPTPTPTPTPIPTSTPSTLLHLHASPPPPPPPLPYATNTNLPMFGHHHHQHSRQQFQYPQWSNVSEVDSTWPRTNADRALTTGHAMNGRGGGRERGGGAIGVIGGGNGVGRGVNVNVKNNMNISNCNVRLRAGMEGGGGFVRRRRVSGGQQQHARSEQATAVEANGMAAASSKGASKNGNNTNHGHNHNSNTSRIYSEASFNFAFDEAKAESNSSDARTTVMIKNIPNKYSQQMLLSMLDQHCTSCNERITDPNEPLSAYDFVYLPIDFKNKCNLGYAFVNMTTSKATWKLYKAFHMQPWEAFNSRKICEVTYARVQGRTALEDHFRNSKFACDTDEYLPLVFSPARNGQQLTPPVVMGGHISSNKTTTTTTTLDDWDSNAPHPHPHPHPPTTTTTNEAYSNIKPYVYRNSSNSHRGYGGHDGHNFHQGRRLQQRPMGGGGSGSGGGGCGCSTSKVGCA